MLLSSDTLALTISSFTHDLPASRTTKAYVEGLFIDQAKTRKSVDLSRESIVLSYIEQRSGHDFEQAQRLGDWLLWVLTWFPASVASYRELAESIGRLSYYRCHRHIPSWYVFEELADCLPTYVGHLHQRVVGLSSKA